MATNHFEQAVERLKQWVCQTEERLVDFRELSMGRTVEDYCSLFVYKPNVVRQVIEDLQQREAERIIRWINGGG